MSSRAATAISIFLSIGGDEWRLGGGDGDLARGGGALATRARRARAVEHGGSERDRGREEGGEKGGGGDTNGGKVTGGVTGPPGVA
jgi:hypothetical protein